MAFFKLSYLNFLRGSTPKKSPSVPSAKTSRSASRQTATPGTPRQPTTLAELERQIEEEQRFQAQLKQPAKPVKPAKVKTRRLPVKRMIGVGLLLGIPVGVVCLVNLPYSSIRRPVAATAPFLLLPSYISLDHHYRLAINTFEQAQQLIDNATTPADLALGEQKLDQAQKSLDALPIDWIDSSLSTYSYYNSHLSGVKGGRALPSFW